FCRTLKLDGYQEFKMRFSLSQGGGEGTIQPDDNADDADSLPRKLLLAHQNAIAETFQLLNPAELEKVLDMLQKAERVYFFGVGDSLLAAEEARNKFLRITPKVICITDPHMQAVAASLTTEKDLVFLISYSGSTKDNIHTARLAKERGAMVACISHFQKSPLTACCDAVLLCGSKEGPLNRGSMSAKSAQLYLIDLLYQSYYERNPEESFRNNELASASVVERSL
ncbi:MAG: MurR/RpiR family transcriptional regulator, partial [Acetatifactor sp.]